jgi:predicted DNA-binding transcriptional regulator AlpA
MNATLLDLLDAGTMLALSTRQVRALVRSGKLPHVALPNGEVRFVGSDLRDWIESHKRNGQEANRAD